MVGPALTTLSMFLVYSAVWEEIYSRLRSLKFAYVSSGSHDLAGQAFLFLSGFLFSFFSPPISPVFFLPDKEPKNKKRKACEGGYTNTTTLVIMKLYFLFL